MKDCEKCMRPSERLSEGWCTDCLRSLMLRSGATASSEEDLLKTLRHRTVPDERLSEAETGTYERQCLAEVRGRSIFDYRRGHRDRVGIAARDRYIWARIYGRDGEHGRNLRLAVSIDNPLVADIECDIRFDKDAVHLTIPRRTNYSRFAGHLQKTATDPLCVGFYPREKSASFTSMDALPKSTADRKALIEKLQLDRMVEERREVCGEV